MKSKLLVVSVLVLALGLSGCASMFTSKTEIHIPVVTKDGKYVGDAVYKSDKEQQDMKVVYNPRTGEIKAEVGKSGTPEAAIAAAGKVQGDLAGIMRDLVPLLKKAAPVPGL
jgi:uncharacterized protein YceK